MGKLSLFLVSLVCVLCLASAQSATNVRATSQPYQAEQNNWDLTLRVYFVQLGMLISLSHGAANMVGQLSVNLLDLKAKQLVASA